MKFASQGLAGGDIHTRVMGHKKNFVDPRVPVS